MLKTNMSYFYSSSGFTYKVFDYTDHGRDSPSSYISCLTDPAEKSTEEIKNSEKKEAQTEN